jgi:hypothetical protein
MPRLLLFACVLFGLLFPAGDAHAQAHGGALVVLTIDSDDAEDQAEALSGAIRSRIRATPTVTLQETSNTLAMLTAALRCSKVPDAACLEKIAAQLKSERFIWGVMQKAPGNQVKAEVHLYEKGKPDSVTRETYSDNLRDQNDDTLRGIARKMLERLPGATAGTLTVRAGNAGGTVLIDGQRRGNLKGGELTVELPVGGHKLEVHVAGYAPASEDVSVMLGKETRVTVSLVKEEAQPEKSETSFPTRKVVGGGLITVGAILGAIAIYEAVHWSSLHDDLTKQKQNNYDILTNQNGPFIPNPCSPQPLAQPGQTPKLTKGCDDTTGAHTATLLGWTLGALGVAAIGAGLYFFLVPGTTKEAEPKGDARRLHFAPYAGPGGGGLTLSSAF